MRARCAVLSVVAMLLVTPALGHGEDTATLGRIRAVVTAIDAAVSRGDADGYVADAAEDAIFLPPSEHALIGRGAIRAWARAAFDAARFDMKHVPDDITVSGDFAYMHGRSVGSFTPKVGGASVPFDNKYVWILKRRGQDRWQIIRVMWNSNAAVKFATQIFDGPTLERVDSRRDHGERRVVALGRPRAWR